MLSPFISISLVFVIAATGCSPRITQDAESSHDVGRREPEIVASTSLLKNTSRDIDAIDGDCMSVEAALKAKRLVAEVSRDIGVVSPGIKKRIAFDICNPTREAWEVKAVHVSCSCTVPSVPRCFPPESTTPVALELSTGGKIADFKQSVEIELANSELRAIRLVYAGKVRAAVTLPDLIEIRTYSDDVISREISVRNYTQDDWSSVAINSSTKWVDVKRDALRSSVGGDFRECWVGCISVNPRYISEGVHIGELAVCVRKTEDEQCYKPVRIVLRKSSRYFAIPARIFSVSGHAEESVSPVLDVSVTLVDRQSLSSFDGLRATIRWSSGLAVACDLIEVDSTKSRCQLRASFPFEKKESATGTLEVQIGSYAEKIQIPIRVEVPNS